MQSANVCVCSGAEYSQYVFCSVQSMCLCISSVAEYRQCVQVFV